MIGLGNTCGHSCRVHREWMHAGWTNRADISAGPSVIHDVGDSAALGDDILPSQVMVLRAESNHSPPSASLESSGHLLSFLWVGTGRRSSRGLIRVICVCSSTSKSPQSPFSPGPSSSSQTSTAPGRL